MRRVRYWWVNQRKTFRHEVDGGYLWSPKRKSDGSVNPFYEFMREVSPGDLVFSYANAAIPAYGIARSFAYEAPKPEAFGAAGRNWDDIGWRVDVSFERLSGGFRPKHWMEVLGPLLPARYSPLRPDGTGMQPVYLTELPRPFALQLADLLDTRVAAFARSEAHAESMDETAADDQVLWEEHLREEIARSSHVSETDKTSLIVARRGQGRFRANVQMYESSCRVTGVSRPEHLRASHCKPWRDATNDERLDGHNGLLLTPSIDHLFDRGFISFDDGGRLLVSPVAHAPSLERMGVPVTGRFDAGSFDPPQRPYLEYHRDLVFLSSRTRHAG